MKLSNSLLLLASDKIRNSSIWRETFSVPPLMNQTLSQGRLLGQIRFSGTLKIASDTTKNTMFCRLIFVLALAQLWESSQTAKILVVVPMPWKSHHYVFQTIMKELANKGHSIDYLTPIPIENPPSNVRHLMIKDSFAETIGSIDVEELDPFWCPEEYLMWRTMNLKYLSELYRNEPKIKVLLKSEEKYDVVMSECNNLQEINCIWAHRFNALSINVLALGDLLFANEMSGLPSNPSYMVDAPVHLTDVMTFPERLWSTLQYAVNLPLHYHQVWEYQKLADETMRYPGWEGRPPLSMLAADQALVLVNSHPAVGYAYPKAPQVKEIGGMTLSGSTALPKDLKTFMDNSPEGVIYFSLGSAVDMNKLTKRGKLNDFLNMFRGLKQKVLLKWMGDSLPDIGDSKILIKNWFPQLGILAHKNTKLFVTHGGLQSLMEAVHFGVPVVSIPIFGDQHKNTKFLVSRGLGVELNKRNLTRESMLWAITEVTENSIYKETVERRSAILRDVPPMGQVQEAAYWVEYVLKHGRVLQPASVHMPFYQVYLLDVAAFLVATLVATYFIIVFTLRRICRMLFTKKNPKNKKE